MDDALEIGIPEPLREAAEEVRAHLVAIRGGGPFLSSADARRLIDWLEAGVAVSEILAAIERVAASRRANRSRLPLTLGAASRYVRKASTRAVPGPTPPGAVPRPTPGFRAIAAQVRARGAGELAAALEAVDGDPEQRLRAATKLGRAFLQRAWDALPDRVARLDAAALELADLDLPEESLQSAAEELARDAVRRDWPMLDVAILWEAAHEAGR